MVAQSEEASAVARLQKLDEVDVSVRIPPRSHTISLPSGKADWYQTCPERLQHWHVRQLSSTSCCVWQTHVQFAATIPLPKKSAHPRHDRCPSFSTFYPKYSINGVYFVGKMISSHFCSYACEVGASAFLSDWAFFAFFFGFFVCA